MQENNMETVSKEILAVAFMDVKKRKEAINEIYLKVFLEKDLKEDAKETLLDILIELGIQSTISTPNALKRKRGKTTQVKTKSTLKNEIDDKIDGLKLLRDLTTDEIELEEINMAIEGLELIK
jgi:hypothetical protein